MALQRFFSFLSLLFVYFFTFSSCDKDYYLELLIPDVTKQVTLPSNAQPPFYWYLLNAKIKGLYRFVQSFIPGHCRKLIMYLWHEVHFCQKVIELTINGSLQPQIKSKNRMNASILPDFQFMFTSFSYSKQGNHVTNTWLGFFTPHKL